MASFTKEEVVAATGARVAWAPAGASFSGISTDTRAIGKGDLFVALKGESFDGHAFVAKAVENGAAGIVVSQLRDEYTAYGAAVFVVADTRRAYQDLARFHRRRFAIPVVAVTGSVGKTSTRAMIASVLAQKFNVLQTEKNFNNEIGLPRTLLQLTPDHDVCVVEMGMRGLGQIAELAAIAEPTVGVVTNVGKSHIELLGTQENIARAKSELVSSLGKDGTAVLNQDDPYVAAMSGLCRGAVVTYGTDCASAVCGSHISASEKGVAFTCQYGRRSFNASIPAMGRHHVYNGLAAAAVGFCLGLDDEQIRRGLAAYKGVPMREEIVPIEPYTFINDAYNANPASMDVALRSLAALAKGRKIAVLGGMLELGEWTQKEHEKIGREVVREGIDILITLGEPALYIAQAARQEGMDRVYTVTSHEEGAQCLKGILQPGDTILLKGSRGFAMERILSYFERESCEC